MRQFEVIDSRHWLIGLLGRVKDLVWDLNLKGGFFQIANIFRHSATDAIPDTPCQRLNIGRAEQSGPVARQTG